LLHGIVIWLSKSYNSINICQKILSFTVDANVILIYSIKWYASKALRILITQTFKKMKLANKYF